VTPQSPRASSDAGTAAGTRREDAAETSEEEAVEEARYCGRPGTGDTRRTIPLDCQSGVGQHGPRTVGEDGT